MSHADEAFRRTRMLLGEAAVDRIRDSAVAVFGIGGVGSYAAEALIRAGVGKLIFIDPDTVAPSNLNRQLIALHSTIGRNKAEIMRERALDINPAAEVQALPMFYDADTNAALDTSKWSYIIDAIDTVTSKLLLVERAARDNIPIISCMGTGNKLDPSRLEVADIYATSVCPLARVMRAELRKRGIPALKTVYSQEQPRTPLEIFGHAASHEPSSHENLRRATPASISFVPSSAGLLLAGEVIRALAVV